MATIRNVGTAKAVTFGGNAWPTEKPDFCGVVSHLSWDNPAVRNGLRQIFSCKDDEVIVAIAITDEGIKAKFERL